MVVYMYLAEARFTFTYNIRNMILRWRPNVISAVLLRYIRSCLLCFSTVPIFPLFTCVITCTYTYTQCTCTRSCTCTCTCICIMYHGCLYQAPGDFNNPAYSALVHNTYAFRLCHLSCLGSTVCKASGYILTYMYV